MSEIEDKRITANYLWEKAHAERKALRSEKALVKQQAIQDANERVNEALFAYSKPLTEQEAVFIESYFTNGLDVHRAMRDAGFGGSTHYSTVLGRANIQNAIHERMKFEKVGVPQLLELIAKLARADMQDIYTIEEWDDEQVASVDEDGTEHVRIVHHKRAVPDLVRAIESGNSYIIKAVEHNRDGSVKKLLIEDRSTYIGMLAEVLGLIKSPGDKRGQPRSYRDRIRESGIDPMVILEELEALKRELSGESVEREVYDASVDSAEDDA